MPIDSAIPLQVKQPQFMNPQQALSLQQVALQMQAQQQDMADKNELRNVGRNYSDEQGQITPEGLKQISNPMVRNQLLAAQQQMMSQGIARKLAQLNLTEKQNDLMSEALVGVYSDYDRNKSTLAPELAAQRFTENLHAKADELKRSGNFSPEQLAALDRVQSPQDAMALLSGTKAYKAYKTENAPKISTVRPGGSVVSTDSTGKTTSVYDAPATAPKEPGAQSTIGKLRDDLNNKRISPEEYKKIAARLEAPTSTMINMQSGNQANDETLQFMAKQYLAGDRSVAIGFGRNPTMMQKFREAVTKEAVGQGMSPQMAAQKVAEFEGNKAGQRTLGTRSANIELAVQEAQNVIPIAVTASDKVDRTRFPNLNAVLMAAEKGTGDENVVRLATATNSLINIYARAISPSGVPTVNDKEHAREILDKAYSKGQYRAAVDVMRQEMSAAQSSPGQVRDAIREQNTGTRQRRASDSSNDPLGIR